MNLIFRACPVCNSSAEKQVVAEATVDLAQWDRYSFASRKAPELAHFRLVRCTTCDLVYANPGPPAEALARGYRAAAYDSAVEEAYAARTYRTLVKRMIRDLPDRSGALDIGAGTGAFLKELQELGFSDVRGVEPSPAAMAQSPPETRSLMRQGVFNPQEYTPNQFRLITCFQTLEHVLDPLALCQAANRLLKKNGAALFVFHNREAFSARLLGRRSPIYDVEHVQLFNPASIRQLLTRSGFEEVRCTSIVNTYPLAYWTKLFPLPKKLKPQVMMFLKMSRLGLVPIPLPAGNFAAIAIK